MQENLNLNHFFFSEYVTKLICFVKKIEKTVDVRTVSRPSLTWLSSNLPKLNAFTRNNGFPAYKIYTDVAESALITLKETFSVYVQGYIYTDDIINIHSSIGSSWKLALNGKIRDEIV